MATFEELRSILRTTYALDSDEGDTLALTLPLTDGRSRRAQRVMVQRYAAYGQEMLEVRSAFGELVSGECPDLLAENLKLPLGAIAVHGRYLVLVHKMPLEHTTVDGVLFLLTRVAELADVLEERRGGDRF